MPPLVLPPAPPPIVQQVPLPSAGQASPGFAFEPAPASQEPQAAATAFSRSPAPLPTSPSGLSANRSSVLPSNPAGRATSPPQPIRPSVLGPTVPSTSAAPLLGQIEPVSPQPEALEPGYETGPETYQPRPATGTAQPGAPAPSQSLPSQPSQLSPQPLTPESPLPTPAPAARPASDLEPRESPTVLPLGGPGAGSRVELRSDRQEYDDQRRIFTATGNVEMRYQDSVLTADRLRVNLLTRVGVAEGNVKLTRGNQISSGERLEYNFALEQGVFLDARGEINPGNANQPFSPPLASDVRPGTPGSGVPISGGPEQLQVQSAGGIETQLGIGSQPFRRQGSVRRLRYEAERIEFNRDGWVARNIRITNDPYSPPELELRAESAQSTRLATGEEEITTTRSTLVLDQRTVVPLPETRRRISRRQQRDETPIGIAFDGDDRGGLYLERNLDLVNTPTTNVTITPQLTLQRAVENGFSPDSLFALETGLNVALGPGQVLEGSAALTGLDLGDLEDQVRANLRYRRLVGTHTLSVQYAYRNRLFNGSLGRQTVRNSFGGVLTSPVIQFGNGYQLTYQGSAQLIEAESDRNEDENLTLGRYQVASALSRYFPLWQGTPLPAQRNAGLRYTAEPVVPFLGIFAGISGQYSLYSNGDDQGLLSGTIGVVGAVGRFSRRFFDYTSFNLSYSQGLRTGRSPFRFDRIEDVQVLSAGFLQQIYGPFRIGVQGSINLDTGEIVDANFVLRYDRRTYGIVLQYNPERAIGSLGLRISDFNWTGPTERFSATGVTPVSGGVEREAP
ncbi:DUF3769 domain-containing protein [Leptolyngbya sp. FACHB-261]|uniref:DUF3769 domain-containing protein n=1 Tax=Leptolyngbya sp. FACHB-261 TaxID=2692806 RepID=UPI0016855A98|nr:DUF3769 domain-containing protein [Leptolyngbya sp. FACHB-261]MBD2103514.1 DUF3769 domain-containing protein [Leptolyngbya sp. FACHB-261]